MGILKKGKSSFKTQKKLKKGKKVRRDKNNTLDTSSMYRAARQLLIRRSAPNTTDTPVTPPEVVDDDLKSGNDSSDGSNTLIHRAKDFGKSLETAGIEGAKLGDEL